MPSVPPFAQDEPQTAEQLYRRLVAAYGEDKTPGLSTIQSTLSQKGAKLGLKFKESSKRVTFARFPVGYNAAAAAAATVAAASGVAVTSAASGASTGAATSSPQGAPGQSGKAGTKRVSKEPSKLAKAKGDKAAAAEREASKAATQAKAAQWLRRPLSAFALFGLSQKGVLKKQKSPAAVKDVVKAIGERWLLLSDGERKKYEAMAEEDARRAEREAEVKPPADHPLNTMASVAVHEQEQEVTGPDLA